MIYDGTIQFGSRGKGRGSDGNPAGNPCGLQPNRETGHADGYAHLPCARVCTGRKAVG